MIMFTLARAITLILPNLSASLVTAQPKGIQSVVMVVSSLRQKARFGITFRQCRTGTRRVWRHGSPQLWMVAAAKFHLLPHAPQWR